MRDYRSVADEVAAEIRSGALKPGDRLPPQRAFARRYGIANSTATRVYQELGRRGLTVGEVGRGTFVRAAAPTDPPGALSDRYTPLSRQAVSCSLRNASSGRPKQTVRPAVTYSPSRVPVAWMTQVAVAAASVNPARR